MCTVQTFLQAFKEEGKLYDHDKDSIVAEQDQMLSEEQFCHKTGKGIRSYIGLSHIPDFDSTSFSANSNPFAAPKQQSAGQKWYGLHSDKQTIPTKCPFDTTSQLI